MFHLPFTTYAGTFMPLSVAEPVAVLPHWIVSYPTPTSPGPKFHLAPICQAVSFGSAMPFAVVTGRRPWWKSYPKPTDSGPRAHARLAEYSFAFCSCTLFPPSVTEPGD